MKLSKQSASEPNKNQAWMFIIILNINIFQVHANFIKFMEMIERPLVRDVLGVGTLR